MSSSTATDPSQSNKRVLYHNGILLDSTDFIQEQDYHRGRLARALGVTLGFGTIAGLKVVCQNPVTGDPLDDTRNPPEQLVVNPGIALDRNGRLIEITSNQCLRLNRWFQFQASQTGANLKIFRDGTGKRFFVGDLFLRFNESPQGLRPGFPEPAADATDAIVASRSVDSFELKLVARDCDPDTALPKVPASRFPATPSTKRQLLDALYAAYGQGSPQIDQEYPRTPEYDDTSSVFLSRVLVRLKDDPDTTLDRISTAEVTIDDTDRPIVAPADLLRRLLPL